MKKLLFIAIAAFLAPFGGFAALVDLSDYLALGPAGTSFGGATFSNFSLLPNQTGATPISPSSILVTQVGLPGSVTLQFDFDQLAAAGELFEMRIGYQVAAFSITGAGVGLANATILDDASATALLDVSGLLPLPPALIAIETSGTSIPSDQTVFTSIGNISVESNVVLDGGLTGRSTLGRASNQFAIAAIPEPGMFSLGLALLASCVVARRRSIPNQQTISSEN